MCWDSFIQQKFRVGYYVPGPLAEPEYTVTNNMDVVPDLTVSLVGETDA